MKLPIFALSGAFAMCLSFTALADHHKGNEGFVALFNGKDLTGWTASKEVADCFSVNDDGVLVVKGGRSHLFYTGEVAGAEFKNFEVKARVRTTPGSNGGFYIHTKYQDEGWPDAGYECQVNSSQKDPKKTGSLYGVVNCFVPVSDKDIERVPTQEQPYAMIDHKAGVNLVMEKAPSTDGEWFDYHITVTDKRIVIRVDGKITVDYTEPKEGLPDPKNPGRKLTTGTFALQAHDPDSETHYESIEVKLLD